MLWNPSTVGLHDHERFLQQYPPYSSLAPADLEALVKDLRIEYHPRGSSFDVPGGIFVIRRGELELGGEHYAEGETLGGGVRDGRAVTTTDTWLYVLPPQEAPRWLRHPALQQFLTSALSARLATTGGSVDLGSTPVRDVMKPLVLIHANATVQEAAARMRDARVSSLLVPLGGEYGIVTDKDLRNKVLAEGLPLTTPVRSVMSAPALSAPEDTTALSAMNVLFRHNIRHLPIMRGREAVGMVVTSDLLRLQTTGPAYVVQDLLDAPDEDTLAEHARALPDHAARLFTAGQRADQVARVTSYAYDALYRRAITLAQAALGPAPGPFAWVLLGSIARREAALNPDQDHVLFIAREEDRPYFQTLARHVEALLHRAGVPLCEGGVMASQHLYTTDEYLDRLARWFRVPDPKAVLNGTIFLDPRAVAGDLDLARVRQARMSAREHPLFMGHLARAALANRPPLGFMRRIRTDRNDTLDIKVRGLALIVDLARLHALMVGETLASTMVRLRAPGESPIRSETRRDLQSAFLYLMDLRFNLQLAQRARNEPVTNVLSLHDLSAPQEVHLREIYKLVGRIHAALAQEFDA